MDSLSSLLKIYEKRKGKERERERKISIINE